MRLRALGYWRSSDCPQFPEPTDLVDTSWDEDERALVVDYLDRGQIGRRFMGISRCRICGAANGSDERTDGEFIWPVGLAHYVEEHGVRLPDAFVAHVVLRSEELDCASVDRTWWVG
ncbi:hypothetical protein [Yinghuangia sp. YIM S09857]|uniref:hypothetical protein n=1 Tax=Yinghuangia sp. YIM S09857 TaxID=3436929 RepID=UPI003F536C6B